MMSEELKKILARYESMYDSFDKGHDRHHMEVVRKRAVELAQKYLKDKIQLAYIAATVHDVGLSINREEHETAGAKIVLEDQELRKFLGDKELEAIAYAVKEHRASTGNPETILAKIICDADRGGESMAECVRRPLEYGKANYPDLDDEAQLKRAGDHIVQKFGEGSYGRRSFFPETEERLRNLYEPIIEAYKTRGVEALIKILNSG